MRTQIRRLLGWIFVPCIACIVSMVSFLAFGQVQPLQQNPPAQAGPMRQREGGGPMGPGMQGRGMQRPGMQSRGMRGPNGPGMGQRDLIAELLQPEVQKELAITAGQRQKLEDIRFNREKESIQHRAALQIQRLELSRLIGSENPDRPAIDKKIQEVAQEETALMRASINARLDSRAVLTAQQRAKLAQFAQNRMRRPQASGMRPGQARGKAPVPAAPAKPPEK
jgi:Spy/CpxP family protein refolding chaperone